MNDAFEDRVAFITGGTRNIGREVALSLAREGASIVLTTRRSVDALERLRAEFAGLRRPILALRCDVGDPGSVQSAVARSIEHFGRIDILVNNAVERCESDALNTSDEAWQSNLATNLSGPFHTARAVGPHMVRAAYGRIVNFSGVAADLGLGAAKAAVKAGVIGLTRGLAHEFGPHGITVNCVSPGLIDVIRDDDRARALPRSGQPVGRMGTTAEVAALVRWLASSEASYVTGQTFRVNGGASFG